MRKTFQYRLFPNKKQVKALEATLEECRWLYNHLLEKRRDAWEQEGQSLALYQQQETFSILKQERPSLKSVHSQVLQNVAVRIDLAFKAFFRRVKAGEQPGFPRFRGRDRYDSFCYPQAPSGCKLNGDRLTLSGIGTVRVVLHRPLEGTPKTVCVRRSSTGKWYVTFACEWEPTPVPVTKEQVGIDVGLHSFAAFSTGEAPLENPRFFRREEAALAKAQRQLGPDAQGKPQRRRRRE